MRTIQLLLQLIDKINANPSIIPLITWNDILSCVLAELDDRQSIYPASQLLSLKQDMINILSEIEQTKYSLDAALVGHHLEKLIYMINALPDADYAQNLYTTANFYQAAFAHYQNDTIIVMGDSHVNFFSGNETLSFLPIGADMNTCSIATTYPFTPLHLGPCLAYNCNSYQSTTQFREKAEFLLEHFIKPNATIVCCLGEIDLRVHVFKQTEAQNTSYHAIVDEILSRYMTFLTELKAKGYTVYCWGPIASQKDSCPLDPQFSRIGSESDRNRATAYFNEQLATLCAVNDIGFLSIFEQMITDTYETIEEYLSVDRCHLGQRALLLAREEWKKINHPKLQDSLL